MKLFIILAAVNAFLAVALGAFGAHGLEGKIPEKYIAIWEKAVTYQMFHAGGLFVAAFLADKISQAGLVTWAGWIMFAGIILFSGSLYVLAVTQISVLGAITPLGGLCFLASWVMIVVAAFKFL
ncbi:DUF423 domain-containing protein [Metabacillus sp. KIGAM252]|uniref:DUF423 domain-containing protein n=1 Tax=Metabacillus flavus TaxID=2823519 RepID=A0ABS5LJI6_9BACI|nr:DUF423 domain-containing protein [Metabacillus flavus]MBS2970916.1 DUF423 domain-containing protein [Metabacillus flavus]